MFLNPIFNNNTGKDEGAVPNLDLAPAKYISESNAGSDLDAAALRAYEEHKTARMSEEDAVHLHIEDIKETSDRLVSQLSNLQCEERK